jgi:hypothetical protein
MKHSIKFGLMGGMILFCLSMCLTSCEDILGKWEKPVPQVPETVVEEAKVLGEALEAGATVTINYTVKNQSYIAIFQKNSDDTYTLISNTAAPATTRAMTRGLAQLVTTGDGATVGDKVQLKLVGNKLVLIVKAYTGTPLFEAQMNVAGGEVTVTNTNALGINGSIGSVSVGDDTKDIKNPEMQSVNIVTNRELSYAIKYSKENNETWADVAKRSDEWIEITTTTDGYVSVKFSKKLVTETIIGEGATPEQAETGYNTYFAGAFYLTSYRPSNTRAMTRAIAPTYVMATDAVGAYDTYSLIPVPVALSAVSTSHIGWVIGSDGKAYAEEYFIPEGTDAVALIAYVGSSTGVEGYTHGLALALTDKGQMSWTDARGASGAAAHTPAAPTTITSSWMLPSKDQWNQMLGANGYGLANLKTSANGYTGLQSDDSGFYWSSTEYDSSEAWFYEFGNGSWTYGIKGDERNRVRACLAF